MDSNLLKVFISVAEQKSISLGAKQLSCAQSNVTSRIKQLEKIFNCSLFHRVSSGVILTKKGEQLYPLAKEVVQKMDQLVHFITEDSNYTLRIGSTEANTITRIVEFLSRFHIDLPNTKLELHTDATMQIVQKILNYDLDVAFISGLPENHNLKVLNKIEEELVIAEPKKIQTNNFLGLKYGCSYRKLGEEIFQNESSNILKTFEFGNFETILGCIELGMGKSVLPISLIYKLKYENRVNIKTLPNDKKLMPTYIVCRKDNEPFCMDYLENYNFTL